MTERVLAERQQREEEILRAANVRVPITMDGIVIGNVMINEHGQFFATINPIPQQVAKGFFNRIREGITRGFTFADDSPPAIHAVKEDASRMNDKTMLIPVIRSWKEFREGGLLWLINRVVFHPRGRALALVVDDEGNALGWQLHGDGSEVWGFDHNDEKPLFLAAQCTIEGK